MGCNPAMMVDPLGMAYKSYDNGASALLAVDFVAPIWPVNTNARFALLDQIMYANQGAFREWIREQMQAEAEGEEDEPSDAAISFVAIQVMYGNGNESGEETSGHNFRTDDVTFDGKNRISILSGNLNMYISTRDDGRIGIIAFAVYKGDLSKYSKTEWIQIAKTNRPLEGKPYGK